MLAQISEPDYPTVAGVLRAIRQPTYEDQVHQQVAEAQQAKGPSDLAALLKGDNSWTV
jgi:2-oxoglutarate ferredoxin oxidoreductase subunit beta